ncbi:MAG TPA: hypothetical protein DIW80_06430 [Gordonia polyisoprenivorans]|nr:hypothetical protein [Gordonia polyisoprenivorans]
MFQFSNLRILTWPWTTDRSTTTKKTPVDDVMRVAHHLTTGVHPAFMEAVGSVGQTGVLAAVGRSQRRLPDSPIVTHLMP